MKSAVAGCPRNCSEAYVKDIGLVAVEGGWELYVGGASGAWRWDAGRVQAAIAELDRHELIETDGAGRYRATPLGQLAGESGTAVASVLRVVEGVRGLPPAGWASLAC